MKISLILFFLIFNCAYSAIAQGYEKTPKQIEADKRFEKSKMEFLNHKYESTVEFYDSLSRIKGFIQLELYKMASESCLILATKNKGDSSFFTNKSNLIYTEAIKWYGAMQIKESWQSIKTEILTETETETFKIVEVQPEPKGGMSAFYKYIGDNLKYPNEARRKGIEGRVFIRFVVNKDGSIDAVNSIKGIGAGCDKEAVRVIKKARNFKPGMQDGKPVYVSMILPITFKLSGKSKKKRKN